MLRTAHNAAQTLREQPLLVVVGSLCKHLECDSRMLVPPGETKVLVVDAHVSSAVVVPATSPDGYATASVGVVVATSSGTGGAAGLATRGRGASGRTSSYVGVLSEQATV